MVRVVFYFLFLVFSVSVVLGWSCFLVLGGRRWFFCSI